MRITAGLAATDQYPLYAEAGADEIFCGYVPEKWTRLYGLSMPLNRREVRYCPVQIGGRNELRILSRMQKDLQVPVTLTFNSPCYMPEQLPLILNIMEDCAEDGFSSFIISDPALLFFLREQNRLPGIRIHLSGETGTINTSTLRALRTLNPERIIFPRQTGIRQMEQIIRKDREAFPRQPLTYEAFIMNEMCLYTGAYCTGLHCDEMAHLCHLPWKAVPAGPGEKLPVPVADSVPVVEDRPCGLCSLNALEQAGINVLKVVGRGAGTEEMIDSIRRVRKALDLVSAGLPSRDLAEMIFPEGCSEKCYYP